MAWTKRAQVISLIIVCLCLVIIWQWTLLHFYTLPQSSNISGPAPPPLPHRCVASPKLPNNISAYLSPHIMDNIYEGQYMALIVPYRDRIEHLRSFISFMQSYFANRLDTHIFVIEQEPLAPFNRAKLMNIGYSIAVKSTQRSHTHFCFHDVDLIPAVPNIDYSIPIEHPQLLATRLQHFNWSQEPNTWGGVLCITPDQMKRANGFSNQFWSWGGEDDDFRNRIQLSEQKFEREENGFYWQLIAGHQKRNDTAITTRRSRNYELVYQTRVYWKTDGLSNLSYQLLREWQFDEKKYPNVTMHLVDLEYSKVRRTRSFYIDCGAKNGDSLKRFYSAGYKELFQEEIQFFEVIVFEPSPKYDADLDILQKMHNFTWMKHTAVWVDDGYLLIQSPTPAQAKLGGNVNRFDFHKRKEEFPASAASAENTIISKAISLSQFLFDTVDKDDSLFLRLDLQGAEVPVLWHLFETAAFALIDRIAVSLNPPAFRTKEDYLLWERRLGIEVMRHGTASA